MQMMCPQHEAMLSIHQLAGSWLSNGIAICFLSDTGLLQD